MAYAVCAGAVFPCDLYVMNMTRDLAPKRLRRITDQGVYVRGLYGVAARWPKPCLLGWKYSVCGYFPVARSRGSARPSATDRHGRLGNTAIPSFRRPADCWLTQGLGTWSMMMIQDFR